MNNDKELIIFDFFGVISSEVAPFWLKKYFDKETAEKLKKELISQVDSGQISEEELDKELAILAKVTPETVFSEWMNLVKINRELTEFIKSIKNHYLIALLSNASDTFLKRILNKYELYDLFNIIIISSEEKMTKPNVEIYKLLLDRMSIKPEKALMIDDNIINLNGAKQAGIEGILYNDFKSFVLEFKKKTGNFFSE